MYNDNIELLKLVHLSQFDIDYEHTTVYVDMSNNEITINLFINPNMRDCHYCKSTRSIIHARVLKRIYHPVIENRSCIILLHSIKFKCNDCGHYLMQFNPIVSGSKNISTLGELYILENLRKTRKTFKDISNELFIPHTSIIRCFDEHVNIHRHNLSKVLCFDDIYSKILTKTKYAFVIFDPISSTVVDILDARLKDCLTNYFSRISIKERLNVLYVNIDMWETYKIVAEKAFPNATICVDSFHVIKHLNDAMDKIRLHVQKRFIEHKDDDKNSYYWLLKTFHYYFVQDFNNIKYERKPNSHYSYLWTKHDVLNKLLSIDKNLADSYWLKEEYREFNLCGTYDEAPYKIDDFIERFKKAHYEEMREFGFLLAR